MIDFYSKFDDMLHWSNRRIERYSFAQDIRKFYHNKGVKEGTLILKTDIKKAMKDMIEHFDSVQRGIILPNTQIKRMANKSQEEIEKVLHSQNNKIFLELGYGDLSFPYDESARKIFQEEIKSNIKLDFLSTEEYKNRIINILETNEDIVRVCLDEITGICQCKIVIIFLTVCNDIAGLPKRDRKAIYEDKQKFERTKKRAIEDLKKLELPYNDVQDKQYENKEKFGSCNYETSLKHYKNMLAKNLVDTCDSPLNKANEISKILEYL